MSYVAEIAAGLTQPMRDMLRLSRIEGRFGPPRCWGPANTKAALRERGLGHGDWCYLTPLGLAVRAHLRKEPDNG